MNRNKFNSECALVTFIVGLVFSVILWIELNVMAALGWTAATVANLTLFAIYRVEYLKEKYKEE